MKAIFLMIATAALLSLAVAEANADGKEAYMNAGCDKCHAVESVGIEATTTSDKMRGPDMGALDKSKSAEWMTQFIKREVETEAGKHKMPFKGTDEELKMIVDWIGSL